MFIYKACIALLFYCFLANAGVRGNSIELHLYIDHSVAIDKNLSKTIASTINLSKYYLNNSSTLHINVLDKNLETKVFELSNLSDDTLTKKIQEVTEKIKNIKTFEPSWQIKKIIDHVIKTTSEPSFRQKLVLYITARDVDELSFELKSKYTGILARSKINFIPVLVGKRKTWLEKFSLSLGNMPVKLGAISELTSKLWEVYDNFSGQYFIYSNKNTVYLEQSTNLQFIYKSRNPNKPVKLTIPDSSTMLLNDVKNKHLSYHDPEFSVVTIENAAPGTYVFDNVLENSIRTSSLDKSPTIKLELPNIIYAKENIFVKLYNPDNIELTFPKMDFFLGKDRDLTLNFYNNGVGNDLIAFDSTHVTSDLETNLLNKSQEIREVKSELVFNMAKQKYKIYKHVHVLPDPISVTLSTPAEQGLLTPLKCEANLNSEFIDASKTIVTASVFNGKNYSTVRLLPKISQFDISFEFLINSFKELSLDQRYYKVQFIVDGYTLNGRKFSLSATPIIIHAPSNIQEVDKIIEVEKEVVKTVYKNIEVEKEVIVEKEKPIPLVLKLLIGILVLLLLNSLIFVVMLLIRSRKKDQEISELVVKLDEASNSEKTDSEAEEGEKQPNDKSDTGSSEEKIDKD